MIVDASALLAFLFAEMGHEVVGAELRHSAISTVNVAEVLGRFVRDGHDPMALLARISATSMEIVEFDARQAVVAARLEPATRPLGLSLGDRACLALALTRRMPALTADRAWSGVDVGVEVRVIR